MMLTLTPRWAAACSMRSTRYCSFFAGGRLKYSSGDSHPWRQKLVSNSNSYTRIAKLQKSSYNPESRSTPSRPPKPVTPPTCSCTRRHTTWRRCGCAPGQSCHSGPDPRRPNHQRKAPTTRKSRRPADRGWSRSAGRGRSQSAALCLAGRRRDLVCLLGPGPGPGLVDSADSAGPAGPAGSGRVVVGRNHGTGAARPEAC